jgi:hypothetical protein
MVQGFKMENFPVKSGRGQEKKYNKESASQVDQRWMSLDGGTTPGVVIEG